jgi:hypothetical protein
VTAITNACKKIPLLGKTDDLLGVWSLNFLSEFGLSEDNEGTLRAKFGW